MGMQIAGSIGSESKERKSSWENDLRRARRGLDVPQVCCGRPMESRLARAHDRLGQTLFVAVWHCSVCERVVF
jgi:hypothetical protein